MAEDLDQDGGTEDRSDVSPDSSKRRGRLVLGKNAYALALALTCALVWPHFFILTYQGGGTPMSVRDLREPEKYDLAGAEYLLMNHGVATPVSSSYYRLAKGSGLVSFASMVVIWPLALLGLLSYLYDDRVVKKHWCWWLWFPHRCDPLFTVFAKVWFLSLFALFSAFVVTWFEVGEQAHLTISAAALVAGGMWAAVVAVWLRRRWRDSNSRR